MDIFIYDNKSVEFIKLPVTPETITIESPQKIETFDAIGQGELKIIGIKGTRKLILSSFFPVKEYPFLKDRTYKGMQYVEKIERWRDLRVPLIILIPDMLQTFFVVIETASYSIQDGSGDIYYEISIEEYKTPILRKISQNQSITTVEQNQGKTEPSPNVDYLQNAYGEITANSGLNLRSGAGTNYSIVTALPKGEKLKLLKLEDGGKWWNVQYNGQSVYVSADYIRRV